MQTHSHTHAHTHTHTRTHAHTHTRTHAHTHTYLDQILVSMFIAGQGSFPDQLSIKQFCYQHIGLHLHIPLCSESHSSSTQAYQLQILCSSLQTAYRTKILVNPNFFHFYSNSATVVLFVWRSLWPGPTVTSVECLLIILIFSEKPFFFTMHCAASAMGLKTCRHNRNIDNCLTFW